MIDILIHEIILLGHSINQMHHSLIPKTYYGILYIHSILYDISVSIVFHAVSISAKKILRTAFTICSATPCGLTLSMRWKYSVSRCWIYSYLPMPGNHRITVEIGLPIFLKWIITDRKFPRSEIETWISRMPI